jgi:WASH complex subunit 7
MSRRDVPEDPNRLSTLSDSLYSRASVMSSYSNYTAFSSQEQKESMMDQFFEEGDLADAPATDLLAEMKTFVEEYSSTLGELREALSDTVSEAWNTENRIVNVTTQPVDQTHILSMITGENMQFNKVTTALAVLVSEVQFLVASAEKQFYGPLTMFGLDMPDMGDRKGAPKDERTAEEKTPEFQMGQFLPVMQDLANFVQRVFSLGRNFVNQLACLFHDRQKLYLMTYKHVNVDYLFEHLGQLCRVLITLDAVIGDNPALGDAWNSYKRMIKYVRAKPENYNIPLEQLREFEGLVMLLDTKVMAISLFEAFLGQDYGIPGAQNGGALVAGNGVLKSLFFKTTEAMLKRVAEDVSQPVESHQRTYVIDLLGLYALYRKIFINTLKPSTNFFKKLWALQKPVPLIVLFGRSVLQIPEFLSKHAMLRTSGLKPDPKTLVDFRKKNIAAQDESFAERTEFLYLQMCMWQVRMHSELVTDSKKTLPTILNARSKLVLNGLLLANQVKNHVTTNIFLHDIMQVPFKAKNIRSIAICVEMLKAIQLTYFDRINMIGENMTYMLEQCCGTLTRVFSSVVQKLDGQSSLDEARLDAYAAGTSVLQLLKRVFTNDRHVVLRLSAEVAKIKNLVRANHSDECNYQLWKLHTLANWQQKLNQVCDCSFIYWFQNLVPAFFQDIFKHAEQVHRLQYLFSSLRDANKILMHVPGSPANKDLYIRMYTHEVLDDLEQCIIVPLCRDIETDLRLHIHSVVLNNENFRNKSTRDLSWFINLKPLTFFSTTVDIRQQVTHYLDRIFYNLTTVALHDWRVYAEMRNLAHEKYGLEMMEVHLPGTSHYSDALDVLQIMRKIHIFVARYNYNMNTQIFIERVFDQKHVNTINVFHIAQSIRTHGTGIMNTTINFTYQFLVKKFDAFSEFLYDDRIKSKLISSIRWFKEEKEALDNKYPFSAVEKFLKLMRKLGVTKKGVTFLDQFRQLITHIGNALGYVRMVRSGGLQYVSKAIQFVPDLNNIPNFADPVEESKLSPQTGKAAQNLDVVLKDLSETGREGTDYFQILVQIFKPEFVHDHLKNFYMMVPTLMLNFVEQLLARKDKVHKKSDRNEAAFTDDGFAMGVAYILKCAKQDTAFDSLHWFDSVKLHIAAKRKELSEKKKTKSRYNQEEELEHMLLTVKRLTAMENEFQLLYYSFEGARIFFRDSVEEAAQQNKEVEAEAKGEQVPQEGESGAPAAPSAPGQTTAPTVTLGSAPNIPVAPPPPPPP